jgi:hypothetical protein
MSWVVLLCEGAHDQGALYGIATICGGWRAATGAPGSLPANVAAFYPRPRSDQRTGVIRSDKSPDYLEKSGCILELRSLGGDSSVLGDAGLLLTKAMLATQEPPDAHAFVVDADEHGVSKRTAAVHTKYGAILPGARLVEAGKVQGALPRVGLWVMPNNADNGSANALLLKCANLMRPDLARRAQVFAGTLSEIADADDKEKATLGAIGQADSPASALSTALRRGSSQWFGAAVAADDTVTRIVAFLDELAGFGQSGAGGPAGA